MVTAQDLKHHARKLGIDDVRVAAAQDLSRARRRIKEQLEAGLFLNPGKWTGHDTESFCNINSHLKKARSVVTACLCYYTGGTEDLSRPGEPHGMVARYTWRNHYLELKTRLRKLARLIRQNKGGAGRVYVNGPLAEKPIAAQSGIGYYGKHSIIIHPRFGSLIVLGEIVTEMEIEPDRAQPRNCGSCRACIDACPTGAILRSYVIDRKRCIQALTNWPEAIPDSIMEVWGKRLYGCSICQDVCPVNKNVKPFPEPRTRIGVVGPSISLLAFLEMDEEAYRKTYARNQITSAWVNFNAVRRNALIALGHSGDRSALPVIRKFKASGDPAIASAARWALSRL